jgi:hypothetical protein
MTNWPCIPFDKLEAIRHRQWPLGSWMIISYLVIRHKKALWNRNKVFLLVNIVAVYLLIWYSNNLLEFYRAQIVLLYWLNVMNWFFFLFLRQNLFAIPQAPYPTTNKPRGLCLANFILYVFQALWDGSLRYLHLIRELEPRLCHQT